MQGLTCMLLILGEGAKDQQHAGQASHLHGGFKSEVQHPASHICEIS